MTAMMLRTTISKICKVCYLGCVPRALRDDFCNSTACHAVIRKAHKTTKSTKDGPGPTEKNPDVPILQTTSTDIATGIPLTRRDKCQKIIDQAFGTAPTDRVSNEQYYSHTVNIEATRREMEEAENERIHLQEQNTKPTLPYPLIPSDRQYSIFKMPQEQVQIGDDKDEVTAEKNTTMEAAPETLVVNEEQVNSFNMASVRGPSLKIDGFEKIQEPNMDCIEVDHNLNISNPVISEETEKKFTQKQETMEEMPLVEAQRPGIEGFNENPMVLGDQHNPALTCKSICYEKQDNFQKGDTAGTYDEVAKRCLNQPLGQIDEILVAEMENIGFPLTCEPDNKPPASNLMGDELVQMDVCKLNLEPEKVTLSEELMKEHELDPYYVLTCSETCPISPGLSMSACTNSDFVDTTETIYMKKNIYESLRQIRNTKSHKIDISQSKQPTLDTHFIVPHSDTVVDFELLHETTQEIEDLPSIKPTVVSSDYPSLQNSEQLTLTELLERVRQINRMQCIRDLGVQVDPTEGECKKAPRCQPTGPRSPPSDPIPPPPFGLPMVRKRPKICKPIRKGKKKCAACDIDVTCGVQSGEIYSKIAYELDETEACAAISRVDLTEVILEIIQTMGRMVGVVLRQVKSNVEALLAREYEPWAPIPSWPIPKKGKKKCDKLCDKWTPGISGAPPCVRGCPVFPKASASMNPSPPCNPKPCQGFPKRTSFSSLDYLAVLLNTNDVYDPGQF